MKHLGPLRLLLLAFLLLAFNAAPARASVLLDPPFAPLLASRPVALGVVVRLGLLVLESLAKRDHQLAVLHSVERQVRFQIRT